jgi:hypothetical protein
MSMTPEEIRERGFQALRERLGLAGAIRFLQVLCPGTGDYTRDRHKWLDHLTLDDWMEMARQHRAKSKKKSRRQKTRTVRSAKSRT